ncbi:YgaP family membrane protein [Marinomonas algicola]|uniref:YgaP family membrane protein n=1 Tax=Marinomonas algicola TaxID=2773454 RepID=UPI001748E6DA|nr:DUF2892 domain-containing protein [Marinomonas algicola]
MPFPSRNLNSIDRVVRGFIGLSVCLFTFFYGEFIGDSLIRGLLFVFGVLNLISFISSWCPVYHLVNLSTYKEKD